MEPAIKLESAVEPVDSNPMLLARAYAGPYPQWLAPTTAACRVSGLGGGAHCRLLAGRRPPLPLSPATLTRVDTFASTWPTDFHPCR